MPTWCAPCPTPRPKSAKASPSGPASPSTSPQQVELARQILGALGQEIFVEEENYLDMATALSGTGPAYVFLFMEALIDAGVHLGFPRRIAEQLVIQTIIGSVNYSLARKIHPAALRNEVTSPGGTSAAALYYLEKAGFRTAISRAVWAAYERSQELGKGKGRRPGPGIGTQFLGNQEIIILTADLGTSLQNLAANNRIIYNHREAHHVPTYFQFLAARQRKLQGPAGR